MANTDRKEKPLFNKIGDAVYAFIDDVTTLDVITLTGNIQVDIKALTDSTGKEWKLNSLAEGMLTKIKASDPAGEHLDFVAFTHYEADCDSVSYFQKEAPKDLLTAHNEAVKAAMASRSGLLEVATSLVGKLFK